MTATEKADLSIVVPLYNEEDNLKPLYDAISTSARSIGLEYEIVFIDDGSSDKTFELAKKLARRDAKLRIIKFRKNYGQTPAMAAGIEHAKGEILLTMDGDLQNDPSDIPKFIEKIDQGYDIVVGWRYQRQDKLLTRKIPSRIANWLIGKITGVPIKDNGCSLKAYRAAVMKHVPLYSEMHRFIPAMTSLTGARIAEIKVKHHARRYGVSKYGLSRIYKVLLDLLAIKTLVSFTSRPLLWFGILAIPAALTSISTLIGSIYSVFADSSSFSIPLAGLGVLFGALTCFLILGGILAELIYKTGSVNLNRLALLTAIRLEAEHQGDMETANGTSAQQQ